VQKEAILGIEREVGRLVQIIEIFIKIHLTIVDDEGLHKMQSIEKDFILSEIERENHIGVVETTIFKIEGTIRLHIDRDQGKGTLRDIVSLFNIILHKIQPLSQIFITELSII
jgi:hypothetical protein